MLRARYSVFSISIVILSLMFTSISNAEIDPKTLAGLWLFDQGSGNVAEDLSGNGNDGKLDGPKWTNGKFGKSLEFDDSKTFVDCGNDKSLDVNSFTLSVWVFPTVINLATHEMIVGKGWSGTERSYYMSILQGKAFVSHRDPGNTAQSNVQGTTELKKNAWYHLAGVHDRAGKTVAIYVNGVKESEKKIDYDVMVTPKKVLIGNLGDHTLFFGGKIDEVAIFNVAVDEKDIKQIMSKGFSSVLAVSPKGKLATVWGDIKQ
jgi:hypothetical protein